MNQQEQQLKLKFATRKRAFQWMLLALLTLGTGAAAWKWYTSPTVYTAQASICIEGEHTPSDFWTNTGIVSATTKATQVITSESFIKSVFDSSQTATETFVKADYRTITAAAYFPFEVSVSKRGDIQQMDYLLTDAGDSSYLLRSTQKQVSTLATFGQPTEVDGFTIVINRKPTDNKPVNAKYTPVEYGFRVKSLDQLTLDLLAGSGSLEASQINDVVKVTVSSENDQVSANYANLIALAYMRSLTGTKKVEEKTTTPQQIIEPAQTTTMDSEMSISDMMENLTELEQQKEEQDQLARNIREQIDEDFSGISLDGADSESMRRNLEKLGSLYAKLDADPTSTSIQSQIQERKKKITDELIEIRKSTAEQIDDIKKELASIDVPAPVTPASQSKNENSEAKPENHASNLLVAATPLTAQSETNPWLWLVLAGALLTAWMIRRIVQSTAEVQLAKAEASGNRANPIPTMVSQIKAGHHGESQVESVKNLCAELLSNRNTKLVSISSLNKNEGKTFVVSNLALALASLDKKVLVLDLAVNNPGVESFFGVTADVTLADVINGKSDILQSVVPTAVPGLDIIATGNINHGIMGVLSWTDNETTVNQLKNYYDFILVDTDEFSQNPGALAIMKWCDLNLIIDASCGTNALKTDALSKIIDKKNLIHTFVVHNSIKEQKEIKKPSKKTNTITENKTEDAKPTHTIDNQSTRVLDQTKRPSLLKRVALWFF